MRASAVLLAVCVVGCFSDAPSGGGNPTDGGTSTGSGSSEGSTNGGTSATSSSSASSSNPGTDDGSSSSDGGAESSGGVSSVCGNTIVEPGEPCDDANGDLLDGCLPGCRLGPTALNVVEGEYPRPVGDEGLITQMHTCLADAPGRALEGLHGGLGGFGMAGDTWPTGLGGRCLQLSLAQQNDTVFIVAATSDPDLPVYGGESGAVGSWSLACPEGTIPIGVRGNVYADATPYIKGIALECATATVLLDEDPPRVVVSNPVTSPYTPGNGAGTPGESICAPDHVAIGYQGRITALPAVQDLGPRCGRIELVFPE